MFYGINLTLEVMVKLWRMGAESRLGSYESQFVIRQMGSGTSAKISITRHSSTRHTVRWVKSENSSTARREHQARKGLGRDSAAAAVLHARGTHTNDQHARAHAFFSRSLGLERSVARIAVLPVLLNFQNFVPQHITSRGFPTLLLRLLLAPHSRTAPEHLFPLSLFD